MSSAYLIRNVNIFDGHSFHQNDIAIKNGLIVESQDVDEDAVEVNCEGKYLIPGLIDCHIHLEGSNVLEKLGANGVTTALDMAAWPIEKFKNLSKPGLPDYRTAGVPATVPGSTHSRVLQADQYLISDVSQAAAWVEQRVAEGSDYIKLISDVPGPSQELLDVLTVEAHKHQKLVIAHAASTVPYEMAVRAEVDFVTHAPLDDTLSQEYVARMAKDGRPTVPTLTMMENFSGTHGFPADAYKHAKASVTALYKAGVPILAGTDANSLPGISVEHGSSIHHELELLVDAGLSNVDALRSATVLAAQYFKLSDRGSIQKGLRADLLLLKANPLDNIAATKEIEKIWIHGVEFQAKI